MNNITQNIETKDLNLFNMIGMPADDAKSLGSDAQVLSFGNILIDNLTGASDSTGDIDLQSVSEAKSGKTIPHNQTLDSLIADFGLLIPMPVADKNIQIEESLIINSHDDSLSLQVNENQDVLNILNQFDKSGTGLSQNAFNTDDLATLLPSITQITENNALLSFADINEAALLSSANELSPEKTANGPVGILGRNNEVITIPRNFGLNEKMGETIAEGIVDTNNYDMTSSQRNSNLATSNPPIFNSNIAVGDKQPLVAVVYPTAIITNDKINAGNKEEQNLASTISSLATSESTIGNSIESKPTSDIGDKVLSKSDTSIKTAASDVIDSKIESNDESAVTNSAGESDGLADSSASDNENFNLDENSADLTNEVEAGKTGMTKNTITTLENSLKSNSSSGSDTVAPIKFVMPAEFNKAALKNGQTVVIKLKPESLGQIRLTLSSGPDTFVGRIVVESPAAQTVIESNINQLYDQLARQGIKVDSFSVALNNGESGNSFAQSRSAENSRQQARWKRDYKSSAISGISTSATSRVQTYVSAYGVNCFA